jgi:hypothetical protein
MARPILLGGSDSHSSWCVHGEKYVHVVALKFTCSAKPTGVTEVILSMSKIDISTIVT